MRTHRHIKRIMLCLFLSFMVLLLPSGAAFAENAPVSVNMELSKSQFDRPGDVDVFISIANISDEKMPGPVYLYSPDGKAVVGFGDGGAVQLDIGSLASWSGTWQVTQAELEDGKITYSLKYPAADKSGNIEYKNVYFSRQINAAQAQPAEAANVAAPDAILVHALNAVLAGTIGILLMLVPYLYIV